MTVEDVDAAACEGGGVWRYVQVSPTNIPQVGRFAIILSPTGAAISHFRPLQGGDEETPPPVHGTFFLLARVAGKGRGGRGALLQRNLRLAGRGCTDGDGRTRDLLRRSFLSGRASFALHTFVLGAGVGTSAIMVQG